MNAIITSRIVAEGSFNPDVLLVKINSNGDTLWAKTFGGYLTSGV